MTAATLDVVYRASYTSQQLALICLLYKSALLWLSPGIIRVADMQDGKVRSIDCVSLKAFRGIDVGSCWSMMLEGSSG